MIQPTPLNKNLLEAQLRSKFKGQQPYLYIFNSISSTNQYLLDNKTKSPSIVVADHQTQGRGRRQASWLAKPKSNILMSIQITNSLPSSSKSFLSRVVSILLTRAINACVPNIEAKLKVKPPNDIYVGNDKLAGILIETDKNPDLNNTFNWIIGIGCNVLDAPQEYPTTCLQQLSELKEGVREHLIAEIARQLIETCDNYTKDIEKNLMQEYDSCIHFFSSGKSS